MPRQLMNHFRTQPRVSLNITLYIMADEATPQPQHETPSLPASPEPKRTKYTEPAANLTVACTRSPPSQKTPLPNVQGQVPRQRIL